MIRIATFNLENLFTRPVAMNQSTDAEGRKAIEDHAEANRIVERLVYTDEDKARLLELTKKYGWHELNPPKTALIQLQKVRGQLFRRPKGKPVEVVAKGRSDWTGWFELRREDVSWLATYNTGRVIAEVNPDILVTVEVENRPTLDRFNDQVLGAEFKCAYPHFMVIDGNDLRGIDLGVMSRFPIMSMCSHVDDRTPSGDRLFSRDCPEYDIGLQGMNRLVVMPNHLKSKRNGNDDESQKRRTAQANRVHEIALAALAGSPLILVCGDMNDTPESMPLAALFKDGFEDVMSHPNYPKDRPGTYGTGLSNNKIDYLLMSPSLRERLQDTNIERRGSFHPNTWKPFDTVKKQADEASDHHLVWADFDL